MSDYERALQDVETELLAAGHAGSCASCNGQGMHAGRTCDTCSGWGDPVIATLRRLRGIKDRPVRHAGHFQAAFGIATGDGAQIESAVLALHGVSEESAAAWSLANVCFALETAPEVFESKRVISWLTRLGVLVDRVVLGEQDAPAAAPVVAEA